MKKRFLFLVLMIVLVVSLFCINASAATYSGTCGDDVTWNLDTSTGELTISGTGSMKDYTSSSPAPWYSYRSSIKTVTISDGVTSIGVGAFYNCTSLTTVEISDSVTSIGDGAFYNDTALISVEIGSGVTSIGEEAFCCCDSLTSVYISDLRAWCGMSFVSYYANPLYYARNLYVNGERVTDLVIPDGVTSIGNYLFPDCNFLTSVVIPDSVTSIGKEAFYRCRSVTTVEIPDSVTSIGSGAFKDCRSLISVEIPDSVKSISSYAFKDCGSLTSVTIPDSVTSLGTGAFDNCDSLTSVYINDLRAWCRISFSDSFASNPLRYAKKLYVNGDLVTDLVIPDGVTSIGKYAFYHYDSLTSVEIPDSVKSIGASAFAYCDSLTSVEIPDSVTSIGASAFEDCGSLTTVAIGSGVTSLGYYVFYNCDSLTSVEIPNSVKSIGDYVFYNCDSLTDVYYYGTAAQWNSMSISSSNSCLTAADRHYMTKSIVNNHNGTHTTRDVCSDCGVRLAEQTETCTAIAGKTVYTAKENKTHVKTDSCICGAVFTEVENCVDADENNICELCEKELVCKHNGQAGMHYTSNDDGKTHKVTVNCELCGEVMYTVQTNETCTDVDGFCSLCGQDLSCRHTQTEKTVFYTANKDGKTHKVTTVTTCTICGEEVVCKVTAEAEECTYSDVENVCTLCTQELPCRHLETDSRTVYADNEDRTHKVFACAVCLLCDEEVSRSVTVEAEPCTDEDDNDVCDKCEGDLYCAHTDGNKLIYISNQDGATHAVSLNCVVCMDVIYAITAEEACTFSGGVCTKCGGEEAEEIEIEKFNIPGANMTLGNELEMNVMFPKSAVDNAGTALTVYVTHYAETGDVVHTFTEFDTYGSSYYKVSFRVNAAQMTDTIRVEIKDADGNVYNNDYTNSVRNYVMTNIGRFNSYIQTLMVDMLNYGAAAQDQFTYHQEEYANALLSDEQKALATGDVEVSDLRVKGDNYAGSTLSLQDRILLNLVFNGKFTEEERAAMNAVVTFDNALDGVTQTHEHATITAYGSTRFQVTVDQFVLADAAQPVTVTVYNADGTVYGSATDSVSSYICRMDDGSNPMYASIMKFAASALAYGRNK